MSAWFDLAHIVNGASPHEYTEIPCGIREPDMLVLDRMLPEAVDGLEVARWLPAAGSDDPTSCSPLGRTRRQAALVW